MPRPPIGPLIAAARRLDHAAVDEGFLARGRPDRDRRPSVGVKFGHNEYFTHNGSGTANHCGDFDSEWKGKNEPDSKIDTLPTDDELLSWAREKLDM